MYGIKPRILSCSSHEHPNILQSDAQTPQASVVDLNNNALARVRVRCSECQQLSCRWLVDDSLDDTIVSNQTECPGHEKSRTTRTLLCCGQRALRYLTRADLCRAILPEQRRAKQALATMRRVLGTGLGMPFTDRCILLITASATSMRNEYQRHCQTCGPPTSIATFELLRPSRLPGLRGT